MFDEAAFLIARTRVLGSNAIDETTILQIKAQLEIMEAYQEEKIRSQRIRIKYTDDQIGRAAKEFGLPKYTYDDEDAGFDLPVVLDEEHRKDGLTIYPGDRVMMRTGMIFEWPIGIWGYVTHRSSTEKRHRLRVIEGVIDQYRNELIAQVHNMNSFPIVIKHGQRLVQLILVHRAAFPIEEATQLRPSKRGGMGFGSSG